MEVIVAVGTAWCSGSARRLVLPARSPPAHSSSSSVSRQDVQADARLSKMTDTYSKASVGYERIREVLDTEARAGPARRPDAPRVQGTNRIRPCAFSYAPGQPVLKDLSFRIEPGQTAAIGRATGAGKTTIASLIPRFYDPAVRTRENRRHGRATSRRSHYANRSASSCRTRCSFAPPSGRTSPTANRRATPRGILRAAKLANADEFIERMPQATTPGR